MPVDISSEQRRAEISQLVSEFQTSRTEAAAQELLSSVHAMTLSDDGAEVDSQEFLTLLDAVLMMNADSPPDALVTTVCAQIEVMTAAQELRAVSIKSDEAYTTTTLSLLETGYAAEIIARVVEVDPSKKTLSGFVRALKAVSDEQVVQFLKIVVGLDESSLKLLHKNLDQANADCLRELASRLKSAEQKKFFDVFGVRVTLVGLPT